VPATPGAVPQNDAAQNAALDGDVGFGSGTAGTGVGLGPSITVGTLTIDQGGTGQLQQVVDGVSVQHVVGQAIVIYAQGDQLRGLPPTNRNAGAAAPGQPRTGQTGIVAQPPANQPRGGAATAPSAARRAGAPALGADQAFAGPVPVAAGIIRLMSDQPAGEGVGTPQRPAASLPATGQELR
jgi:hypothetical protein